jgi:hypothetical protein
MAMLLARGTYEPMDHMNMVSPRGISGGFATDYKCTTIPYLVPSSCW